MSAYRFSLAQLAAVAHAVPDPEDAALFAAAWQELTTRLRSGDYPAEEAATWERMLEQLADLVRVTRSEGQEKVATPEERLDTAVLVERCKG